MKDADRIAAALQYLAGTFADLGLAVPEVVVSYDDLTRIRSMVRSDMVAPRGVREKYNKIMGVIIRPPERPEPLYTYYLPHPAPTSP